MTPDDNTPETPTPGNASGGDTPETAPRGDVPAEAVPPEQKLADPAATGNLPSDPAASVEKPAEAAAPAPEGAQPTTTPPATEKAAKPAAERPARPAKAEEPKEAPRVAPPAGSINEVLAAAVSGVQFKAAYTVPSMVGESVCVEVAPADIPAVMTACRDDARLDLRYLRSLSGVDWQEEGLEVVYHLLSIEKKHHLTVKTRVTYDDATVPSIAAIYPAADWHERETRDMFGIDFPGHWNLVPLLLPEDMTDHFPLRKDNPLQEIEEWQGDNLRDGAGEGDEE
jgi:NADH-quinone oxidoreductase subunit C